MTLNLQIVIIICCLLLLLYIAYLVKRGKLSLRLSLFWIVLAVVLLIFAIWPAPIYAFLRFCGFEVPANGIQVAGLLFLAALTLFLCSVVSKQSEQIKNLTQEIAILKNKFND